MNILFFLIHFSISSCHSLHFSVLPLFPIPTQKVHFLAVHIPFSFQDSSLLNALTWRGCKTDINRSQDYMFSHCPNMFCASIFSDIFPSLSFSQSLAFPWHRNMLSIILLSLPFCILGFLPIFSFYKFLGPHLTQIPNFSLILYFQFRVGIFILLFSKTSGRTLHLSYWFYFSDNTEHFLSTSPHILF